MKKDLDMEFGGIRNAVRNAKNLARSGEKEE